MPSTWPEPFGLVGLEAARAGVPAAAFDVGGIRDWLIDGQTGALAPGDPPTAAGLATAIVTCVHDESRRAALGAAARAAAATRSPEEHAAGLVAVFATLIGARATDRAASRTCASRSSCTTTTGVFGHSRYVSELAERFRGVNDVHVFANTFDGDTRGMVTHNVPALRATALTTILSFYAMASTRVGRQLRHRPRAGRRACPTPT